jgi:hypothetical protein
MEINEITLNPEKTIPGDPLRFRVGEPVVEGGHVVEKINFHPENRTFNKGLEIGTACYAVYFENIPERRLVVADVITTVEAVKAQKTDNPEATVPLAD